MNEQALRTTIRGLMASGALPTDPYADMTRMEAGHQALPDEHCAVRREDGPQVSYTYRDGNGGSPPRRLRCTVAEGMPGVVNA